MAMAKESKVLIGILVGVVTVMVGLFMLTNTGAEPDKPKGDASKVVREDSHKKGSGPIQLVEFGDYECPACFAAEPNVQKLLQDYDGKVSFYFRNFPLEMHQNAQAAAQAAEAAGEQGKYWEMHDLLYVNQKTWSASSDANTLFIKYAKDLKLDEAKFTQAIEDKKFQTVIDQDYADGEALGVNSTPTFFFNGQKFTGSSTYESLKAEVDKLLAASGAPAASPAASPAATPAP
jgi:protein-disulfide isomerase